AEVGQPAQHWQLPVVALLQATFRRMRRHREIAQFHGRSLICYFVMARRLGPALFMSRRECSPRLRRNDGSTHGQPDFTSPFLWATCAGFTQKAASRGIFVAL